MADKKDYYETLGISRSASESDIKKAYRKQAKKYHPDANPGNKKAEERFKDIQEAYSVLSDEQKKANYDQFGHSAFESGGGSGGFYNSGTFDMGDIFESFFGGGGDVFSSRSRTAARRGADVQTSIKISFEESFFGTVKNISIYINDTCDACKGSGAKSGTKSENCKHCNGVGEERVVQQTMFGTMASSRTCSVCRGTGKMIINPCNICRGSGIAKKTKNIEITLPKGIDNGQTVRLSGKGEPGVNGGAFGDLLVVVYVAQHKSFTREGLTIYAELPITFTQAALGSDISIITMEDTEKYTIKPGTQSGAKVHLRGKGFPSVKNAKVLGDMIVILKVVVPKDLTDKQKSILMEFEQSIGEGHDEHKEGFFDKIKKTFK